MSNSNALVYLSALVHIVLHVDLFPPLDVLVPLVFVTGL